MQETWVPQTQFPEKMHNCIISFIGYDERPNKSNQLESGFYIDIETYEKNKNITLFFERVEYYSWSDELRRHKTLLKVNSENPGFYKHMIFSVFSSSLLKWFYKENNYVFSESDNPAMHYVVITTDDFVDIIVPINSIPCML